MSSNTKTILSIVVPAKNENESIPQLYNRLKQTCDEIGLSYEIIFVDDGSTDDTLDTIKKMGETDQRIKALSLSRNFGQQAAILAGLEVASGQAIVIIDADLQDPPELIKEFVSEWQKGFDLIYGYRSTRHEGWLKVMTAKLFYRLLRIAGNDFIPIDTGEFRLIDRHIVSAVLKMREPRPFIRGITSWTSRRPKGISFSREARSSGRTNYSLPKMTRLASDAFFSFSQFPFKAIIALGMAITALTLGFVIYQIIWGTTALESWHWLVASIVIIIGLQTLVIGLIGEYTQRIYDVLREKPHFLIKEKINFDSDDN